MTTLRGEAEVPGAGLFEWTCEHEEGFSLALESDPPRLPAVWGGVRVRYRRPVPRSRWRTFLLDGAEPTPDVIRRAITLHLGQR